MIQLYTGTAYNSPQYTRYAHPLLQYLFLKFEKLTPLFQLTNTMTEANFFILPLAIEFFQSAEQKKYLNSFILDAKKNKTPILIFSTGDFGTTINDNTIHSLRLGGFDSKLDDRTEIMSPFIDDPLLFLNKEFKVLAKTLHPHIGFVGHANGGVLKYIKEVLLFVNGNAKRFIGRDTTDYQHFYPSSYYRSVYLKKILHHKEIEATFIFRKKYRAGVVLPEDKWRTSLEFYNNIFENQYVFCLRGAGNFSVRLYETLALGRIPVLINTDCRLPFQNQINWKAHCVFIELHEVAVLAEKIINFHKSNTDEEFQQLQRSNRVLWETYFTKENYFLQYAKVVQECLLDKKND